MLLKVSRILQRASFFMSTNHKIFSRNNWSVSGDSFIHPTAVVHPNAVLGRGVSVGPFCSVGPNVEIGDASQLKQGTHVLGNTKIGENCVLLIGAIVGSELPGCTQIGRNNVIGHHAAVGVKCQDLKYKSGDECFLDIGDNNDIREYTSIHRSSKSSDKTVIGDNNLIMGSCHIAHDCKLGNNNIFANNTLFGGHVVVEDHTHTGGAVIVHQFCHIGSFSFLGGGSVVVQDVPRYLMVAGDRAVIRGLNIEGLRRGGFSGAEIRSLRQAYRNIFMPTEADSENIDDRITAVMQNESLTALSPVFSMMQSIRDSFGQNRRGICKF